MALICYIIPFVTCLILFMFFRRVTAWWEYLVIVFPSVLFTLILYFSLKNTGMSDVEYLGYYVTKVSYYEPWNEYIHKTCTREVYDGHDSEGNAKYRTETYDCSYVDYHPARWTMTNNTGYEIYISENRFNIIARKFNVHPVFVDMHRHYHTIDGDKYEHRFDGNRNKMYTLTEKHSYKNKILRSKSIFNFSEVPDSTKVNHRLFDYNNDFSYDVPQNPIMSEVHVSQAVIDSFRYVNAIYGSRYQFRTYVMVWKNAPLEVSTLQENYFVGGNKNELCICISVDNQNNIQWVRAFSWEDKPEMVVGVNHLYKTGEKLDLMKLNRYILKNVPKKWKRKEFADFEYINIALTSGQWILILVLTLIYNIIAAAIVICNDEYADDWKL